MGDAPSIGIVIPSLNSARYIRDAIESVLRQRCSEVRCLVMDGGSTDGTVEIARSYGDAIQVVSEPDDGQADAIQKGFDRLPCELLGWLNADDRLLPGSIGAIRAAAIADQAAFLFHGDIERVDRWGRLIGVSRSVDIDYERMRRGKGRVVQPGSFVRRAAWVAAGGLRPEFHLLMDVDLWIRVLRLGPARRLNRRLAQFRVHAAAKSSQPPYRYYRESLRIAGRHELDHLVRALVRRGWNIVIHFAMWSLGRLLGAPEPPPRPVPRVRVEGGRDMPAALTALQTQGAIVLSDTIAPGERPDVEVCVDPTRQSSGTTRRDLLLCDGVSLGRLVQQIEDGALGPAFIIADRTTRAAIERAGYPTYRIGEVEKDSTWRRAIAAVTGSSPAWIAD